ncbi:MAG: hypothetical protein WBA67_15700 [Jannaschia sp.]
MIGLTRYLVAAVVGGLTLTGMATAQTAGSLLYGQRADIARELPAYGYADVDVARLSTRQVAHISHLLYSDRGTAEIHAMIGSTLRRGFLQRVVDGALR